MDIPAQVNISSCISENRNKDIASDGYITYFGGNYSLDSCQVTISVRDDTWGTTVARQTLYGCGATGGYFGPVYHAAVSGHHYHTYLWVVLTLSDGNSYLNSDVYPSWEEIAG